MELTAKTAYEAECSICAEPFKVDELQHGICPKCQEEVKERLGRLVRSNFDEAEIAVINDWAELEVIGF